MKLKETKFIEFKSTFNDSVIETLSAFANTKGGKVLVGVNNSGNPIKGFVVGDETIQRWINEIKNKTQPGIIADAEIKQVKGVKIVELAVQEFPVKPVAFKQRYYKRVNNSNQVLSVSEISNAHMQSLQLSWDSYPYKDAKFTDLHAAKIKAFIKKVNASGRFLLPEKTKDALIKLKYISNEQVSNAAVILFAKENLNYNVHVGRFKTPSLIIDDKLFNGTLFDVLENTMVFIIGHLKVAFEVKGQTTQRNEIFEYPIPAIRELLLNCLVHRDYSSPSDVQIKIFDKKISFFNPGKLFGNIEIKDLRSNNYASQTRNKLLAEALYLTKDIEKYGSGFMRIRNEIEDYRTMKFIYSEQGNGFLAELKYEEQKKTSSEKSNPTSKNNRHIKTKNNVTDNVTDNVTNNVTDNVTDVRLELIMAFLLENEKLSSNELAIKTGVTKRTILRDLEKLKAQKFIERIGSAKDGYWKVKKKTRQTSQSD